MSPRVVPVPVKSIDELGDVVSIAEVMGFYHVKSYGALLGRIASKRIPAPFASRPMQFRKSDIAAQLNAVPGTRRVRRRA
jgi:hypothetical protein